jgi:hypothetical protein
MRKVTKQVVAAFLAGEKKTVGNTSTDGQALYLHGNKIAEFRGTNPRGLYITNAGWRSNTTKERLNGLPNVRIHQNNYQWYLNGNPWDGGWILVDNA